MPVEGLWVRGHDDDERDEHRLSSLNVSALTVISWVGALVTIIFALGWVMLISRLDGLENGRTLPMSEATRIKFEQAEKERTKNMARLDRLEDRVDALEREHRAMSQQRPNG